MEQVAGVGIPDLEWGEKIVMQVIAKEGLTKEALHCFAQEKLASTNAPNRFCRLFSSKCHGQSKKQRSVAAKKRSGYRVDYFPRIENIG